MKVTCPTCKLKKRKNKVYGWTEHVHEDDCPTGKMEAESALPFEALLNPSHPAYKKTEVSNDEERKDINIF